jgi:inhibitor of KinA sporulation pathway (predicted exonuclease)
MNNAYACNIVIDLEFTPVPKAMRRKGGLQFEIIEVGAVKVAPDGTIAGESSHMVKPCYATGVSGVVHHITGIGDEDLTCARPLGEVLDALSAWIGPRRARMVTWSKSDLRQIREECAAKGIEVPLPSRWMDIQRLYTHLMGLSRGRMVALSDAAEWFGITTDHTSAHRALYDAQVTAEVFRMMATGECAQHRARVQEELRHALREPPCKASIAERCGGLADLLASLKAQEAAA